MIPAQIIDIDSITVLRNGNRILDRVSFTAEPGEHWAFLGPNGSGKTTFLNILTGYLWPSTGTVTVLGDRYGQVDLREKRRQIGLVSSALFERVPPGESFFDIVLSGRFASLGIYDESDENGREGGQHGHGHLFEHALLKGVFKEAHNGLKILSPNLIHFGAFVRRVVKLLQKSQILGVVQVVVKYIEPQGTKTLPHGQILGIALKKGPAHHKIPTNYSALAARAAPMIPA